MTMTILPLVMASYENTGPSITLLYFLGLLSVVNAPFDWVAIGITRGLLRRGLELGALWPLVLALGDFLISLLLMAVLAFATLWATEIYNHSIVSGGGRAVIDVGSYLDAMADPKRRGDPYYYWLYAMLFSSQIPAILNFAVAALCLLRGVPAITRRIAAKLPEDGEIGTWRRLTISGTCAAQFGLALAVGLGCYYALVWGLIRLVDPLFATGLVGLLRMARLYP